MRQEQYRASKLIQGRYITIERNETEDEDIVLVLYTNFIEGTQLIYRYMLMYERYIYIINDTDILIYNN